jgi:hypothetical protein
MSLYEIQHELMALLDMATETDKSAELEAAMQEHTNALIEAFDAKVDDYAALIRMCETRAENRMAEVERMKKLAEADDALATKLRQNLIAAMQQTKRTKVQTPRFALSVVANGGKTPVQITDEDALPEEFKIPVYSVKIDKEAIRTALENGEPIDGATLLPRGVRLSLK